MSDATMPRPGARILLLGADAESSLGDRAIVAAIARCLSEFQPSTELTIVGNPAIDWGLRGVTHVIPRGPAGLPALLRTAARAARVLVIGNIFHDDDSRADLPYWAARLALLRACKARIVGLALGAGPLGHADSRAAARTACAALERLSVRDRQSRDALAPCTSRPIEVVADPAFMLDPIPVEDAVEYLRRLGISPGKPLIAVTMRRWFHARGGFLPGSVRHGLGLDPARDHARFEALLGVACKALEQLRLRLDADHLLLPGASGARDGDDAACEALRWRLPGANVRLARVADPRLFMALLGRASLVVSARMHPLVLAAGMGIPFVGLSYNGKFDGVYDSLGLPARSLPLDLCPDAWGATTLVAAAEAALEARVDLRQRAQALGARVRAHALAAAFGVR
jgi:polysaccharide pyruvyl transferase WcaK-like protein